MFRSRIAATLTFALAFMAGANAAHAESTEFQRVALPFLEKYCHECHGGKKTKADLDLKQIKDDENILQDIKRWRGLLHQVGSGEMPPKKHPARPSPAEITAFTRAIEDSFTRAEAKLPPDPGRVTARRLNRTEYHNTVGDLLGIDFNPTENFPADDIGHGFDNIGDVLSVSPVHLERYLDAAEGIAARVVLIDLPKPPSRTTYSIFLEPGGYGSENGTRPVTNAVPELFVRHEIKVAGKYTFKVRAGMTNNPSGEPIEMSLMLGTNILSTVTVTNHHSKWQTFEIDTELPVGEQRFAARWMNRDTNVVDRILFINEFKVIGPADMRTDFMRRVAAIAPGEPEADRIRKVTEWFLTRAFRRPPTTQEMERYTKVVQEGMAEAKDRFEGGLHDLVRAVLVSPKFLFRLELDDRPRSRDPQPLDDFQLASRLSYFLWSTMPDEELLGLAARGELSGQLEAQVKRMLKDERSSALVKNFGMQWLQLQRLSTFQPDVTQFPEFNDVLRKSMLRETELFLDEIVHEDRSILDLVDADFTFVNRPLAKHYALEDLAKFKDEGQRRGRRRQDVNEFVRVRVPDGKRGGLLTHASILTATSNPTRTSPVKRGKWVLEQILGTPPPAPPPNVPELEEQKELTGTLRQRMEQHRSNPSCANCHQQMDALGFAFENFDAIGRFRTQDGEGQIDPSGTLPDGKSFSGASELKRLLKDNKKELLARNLTEKLMTYGLGRGLEFYDERSIKKALADLAQADYRFSALVTSIVKSDPFRLRRGKESNETAALGN